MDKELNELLDKMVKGQLSETEKTRLEELAKQSEAYQQMVSDHQELIDAMVEHGNRVELKQKLNQIHDEVGVPIKPIERKSFFITYWKYAAVAASITLISVIGTVLITENYSAREAEFVALRRNIDQIKKSQKILEKDIAETKKKSAAGNYAGTCFMISRNGYLITSYHVVKDADSINIENGKFGTLKAAILYNDPANDVSILKVDTLLYALPYQIENTEASLAEDVYTLGYPREDVVFGEGSISALSGYRQNPNSYQVSVPVNPGNSGGPLLNNKGNLVGMISGLQTETLGAAFAVKSNVLLDIVGSDSLKNEVILSKLNTIRNAGRVAQVKQWTDYVFMVRVFKTN